MQFTQEISFDKPVFLIMCGFAARLAGYKVLLENGSITELVATIAFDKSTFVQSTLTVIEYAIIKTPLMTLIITSFLFRICHDFPFNSVMYFFHPLILYVVVFYSELMGRWRRFRKAYAEWWNNDIDIAQHRSERKSSNVSVQIREEVSLLLEDMYLRLKRSLFAGVSTAFLSIFLPCVFVPYKTSLGVPQKVLVDEAWESELCIVVALTAFSLYITYLMPLNYLDLLHRSAIHLGTWDQIEGPKIGQTGQANWAPSPWVAQCLYSEGETVQMPDGRCYKARGSSSLKTVA
ncbi:unnamed protein product, partial [Strongylus vulgaris]